MIETREKVPAEFVLVDIDRSRHKGPSLGAFYLFSGPIALAVAAAVLIGPQVSLAVLIATAGALLWWWLRDDAKGTRLTVENGLLFVEPHRTRQLAAQYRLRDIEDVVLDTKTIRRIHEGASPIPALRYLDSQVGPEVDTARILLVVRGKPSPVALNDIYLAHMDASEMFGKLRVFLRKHGWLPKDERSFSDEA